MKDKRLCHKCNHENESKANFCEHCGSKIAETCPRCWVKNEQPYNCGLEKCPGYRLHVIEKLAIKNNEDYPTKLVFKKDISNGIVQTREGSIVNTSEAITITIDINYNKYPLKQLREAINEICQLIPECFH